jgi:hypothetical protein
MKTMKMSQCLRAIAVEAVMTRTRNQIHPYKS